MQQKRVCHPLFKPLSLVNTDVNREVYIRVLLADVN